MSVANVTEQMTETCTTDSGCSSTLPNGAYYNSDGGYRLNMTSTANGTVAFADLKSPIVDFSLALNQSVAIEAVLYYCVQTFQASVKDGQPNIQVMTTYTNFAMVNTMTGLDGE